MKIDLWAFLLALEYDPNTLKVWGRIRLGRRERAELFQQQLGYGRVRRGSVIVQLADIPRLMADIGVPAELVEVAKDVAERESLLQQGRPLEPDEREQRIAALDELGRALWVRQGRAGE